MTHDVTARPNPYAGPRPFETGMNLYGREREKLSLRNLLIADRIVLLHSPSGAGKTSLIQAALIPELSKKFFILPVIRVSRSAPGLTATTNRYLASLFLSLESDVPEEQQRPLADLLILGLPAYLDQRQAGWDERKRPLLIVDQFEEILSLSPTDQDHKREFFEQIGEALEDRRRWALFAMREDYVGALASYRNLIPNRLASAFRLDFLTEDAARQAMQNPVAEQGVTFATDASQKLVDDLRLIQVQQLDGTLEPQPGPHIEPVHLQVVCSHLWEQLPPEANQITLETVKALGSADEALADYYADKIRTVAKKTEVSERVIRDWVEKHLITEQGVRRQVLQDVKNSEGLPNAAIKELVDSYLVREERQRGANWFELAHDRLIKPVQRSNADWRKVNLSLLQRQAALWDSAGEPDGLLLSGQALAEAEVWAERHPEELNNTIEGKFLSYCKELEAQQHQELETARRMRVAFSVIAALSLLFSIALYAFLTTTYGFDPVDYTFGRDQVNRENPFISLDKGEGQMIFGWEKPDLATGEQMSQTIQIEAFAIQQTEVTNRQYRICRRAGGCHSDPVISKFYENPLYDDYPVVYINAWQAREFCRWLGGDLPESRQWERAARGLDGRLWPWKSDIITPDRANIYFTFSDSPPTSTVRAKDLPSGATPEGILNLVGNVWEWTRTQLISQDDGASFLPYVWNGTDREVALTERGGSWGFAMSRITEVQIALPENFDEFLGFRCVINH